MDFLFKNCLFLAPMAGYSDAAYRRLLKSMGADFSISEFVHSNAVLSGAIPVLERLRQAENEGINGIQIFGSQPEKIAECALYIEENFAPAFIDINFGCPAQNAVGANAGAALLKTPEKMVQIIKTVSSALKKTPLTAKMRTGFDSQHIIAKDVIPELVKAGANMITLHGRTAKQGYTGPADWDIIEECAEICKVPLIGNGSAEKLSAEFLRHSKCYGFMIGRAALIDPWVFEKVKAKINNAEFCPPPEKAALMLAKDYLMQCERDSFEMTKSKLTHLKAQIVKFLKGARGFKQIRINLLKCETFEEITNLIYNEKL